MLVSISLKKLRNKDERFDTLLKIKIKEIKTALDFTFNDIQTIDQIWTEPVNINMVLIWTIYTVLVDSSGILTNYVLRSSLTYS
jgi:hypothetical protein